MLDLIIGHIHWAPKVVPVLGIFLDVRLCEDGVRGSLVGIIKPGSGVNGLICNGSDGIGPSFVCMYHGGSCHILKMSDAHFGLSVLVVSVDAREGKALLVCVAVVDPVIRGEGAIVGMIIYYPHPYFTGEPFKGFLCL